MNGLTRRRYYFWPIMLVLVSVFFWRVQYQPQPHPSAVNHPVRVIYEIPTTSDLSEAELSAIPWPKRYILDDKVVNGRLEVHGRVEIYRGGKWIKVLPAK